MKTYTSKEIIEAEDLYELQDEFCSSGITFKYQMTKAEFKWAKFIEGKYSIADYVLNNTDENLVLTFEDPEEMSRALLNDGIPHKAVMLDDKTALQKIVFLAQYKRLINQNLQNMKTIEVIFRKFKNGEIIGLFPFEIWDRNGNISSYMQIGQHGGANPLLITELKKATKKEYLPLLNELKIIGYKNLTIKNL